MIHRIGLAITLIASLGACAPPQGTAPGAAPATAAFAPEQATLGGGPCPITLPPTPSASVLEEAFQRSESCRRSRALRIDKLHTGGQLSKATAAAQIITLRGEARRDIETMRALSQRLEPGAQGRISAMLVQAETGAKTLELR